MSTFIDTPVVLGCFRGRCSSHRLDSEGNNILEWVQPNRGGMKSGKLLTAQQKMIVSENSFT